MVVRLLALAALELRILRLLLLFYLLLLPGALYLNSSCDFCLVSSVCIFRIGTVSLVMMMVYLDYGQVASALLARRVWLSLESV